MNTSSSDVAIGRTLVDAEAGLGERARSGVSAASAPDRSIRTCARSPNICTSVTPGMLPEDLRRAAMVGDDDFEQRARTGRREARPGDRARAAGPRAASATREHRSASSRYGVAITMVMPCARNSDSSFQNSRRDTGSTPVVGSSSTIERRLVHERAGERQLLLHAARQPVGEPRPERRELRHLEQAIAPRRGSRATPWISAKNAMFSSTLRSPYRLKRCER